MPRRRNCHRSVCFPPRFRSMVLESLESRLPLAGEPIVDLNGTDAPTFPPAPESLDYADNAFFAGAGPVLIVDVPGAGRPGLAVTDTDSDLISAAATIRNPLDGSMEVLSVDTTGTPIVATYAAPTLTLTGAATPQEYERVLRTLSYDNLATDPTILDREVEVVVNDGTTESLPAVSTISMVESLELVVDQLHLEPASEDQFAQLETFLRISASSAPKISGFQVGVRVSPAGSGASVQSILASSDNPYVFAGSVPIGSVNADGSAAIAGDLLLNPVPQPIEDGDGLLALGFKIDGGVVDGSRFDVVVDTDGDTFFAGSRPGERFPFTVVDGRIDVRDPLVVTELRSTPTGFVADFNQDLEPTSLNLYDARRLNLGAADLTLQGATSGPVAGSLIVQSARSVVFVKTGEPLVDDTYSVVLQSGASAFQTDLGMSLDGNGDGTVGDQYEGSFQVSSAEAAIAVSIPDFVRGAGQDVHLPADTTSGIPVTLSDSSLVRSGTFSIGYDPALLTFTAAAVAEGMPAGSTASLDTSTPGVAVVTFSSPAVLPAGANAVVALQATVPTENAADLYGATQLLDIHAVSLIDAASNSLAVIDDDAVHVAAFFGDVSGNGRVNAADASQIAGVAATLDSGFEVSPRVDPLILADISGNRRLNALDASSVARFAALLPVPDIPPIPVGVLAAGGPQTPDQSNGRPTDEVPVLAEDLAQVVVEIRLIDAVLSQGNLDWGQLEPRIADLDLLEELHRSVDA